MDNMQKTLEQINSKVNKLKKRIELIELIEESSKYNGIELPFQLDRKYSLDFDLKKRELYFIFNEILEDLIELDFKIDLDIKEIEKEINTTLDGLMNSDLNNIELLKIKSLFGILLDSYDDLQRVIESNEVNIFDMLLKNKKTELISEIIISDKVKIDQKKYLLNQLVNNYPNLITSLSKTPSLFYYAQECGCRKLYEEKFSHELHLIFSDKEENAGIVRNNLTKQMTDGITKLYRRDVIKFFINNKLVDINDINWMYKNHEINFAAASFLIGFNDLGEFIYSMDDYKKSDITIRNDSDMAIIDFLFHKLGENDLCELIKNPNFECSAEKFDYIINLFAKKYIKNPTNEFKQDINKVVNILLRKTKKEDYKKVKEYIKNLDINMNIDLLNQKRENLTSVLGTVNDLLMEQVPAKTKIKDIKFQQK